jgi:hypothetical protein
VEACCGDGGPEDTLERCTNGVDDDCNGFTDCRDFACSRGAAIERCCVPAPERDAATCGDRVDGDCDGLVDCEDPDCTAAPDRTFCLPPCVPGGDEATDAACANGRDDDCDGYTDCVDFGCSRAPAVTVCAHGSGLDCTSCASGDDCAGGLCVHYTAFDGAPFFCSRGCSSDAECGAALPKCSAGGVCSHAPDQWQPTCVGARAFEWRDDCGLVHATVACEAGESCVTDAEGRGSCKPPCVPLGAIVNPMPDGSVGTCCPGTVRTFDPAPPTWTERCMIGEGAACTSGALCATGLDCLAGACAGCEVGSACSSDADCCDDFGCNGGRCDMLCGSSCRSSSYEGGIFCSSNCVTRFTCRFSCSDP